MFGIGLFEVLLVLGMVGFGLAALAAIYFVVRLAIRAENDDDK